MKNEKPREYTEEEIRRKFIEHVWVMIDYWNNLPAVTPGVPQYGVPAIRNTQKRRLSGLAHSIFAALDGSTPELPAFVIAPIPHPDDKEYHKAEGENWFPENDVTHIKGDIGPLHSILYSYGHKD